MSIGPLNEILVSITNIIRKSEAGSVYFNYDDAGEERFDEWQSVLLKSARLVHETWATESDMCETALDIFEKTFSAIITPAKGTSNE